ncbi:hypothetical protein [Bradyrhizobium sp.]|jgi:hypothetical protein|uniref:hypothetical protein n=1 Tax=Bradyrhizobium sp. TaxID=376 RepID=UPI002D2D39C2|nr:hypothetical protein [Bradyrhizobium sp.]HZR77119.1 hypothetical protein [Bradyrhizobium sp.]
MPRFLIRAGSAGDWMVWDRAARGPATLNNRKLSKLSRQAAQAALGKLLSSEDRANEPAVQAGRWQVLYADRVVDCRDVGEAQILARTLVKKGLKVSARLINGPMIVWTVEDRDQMRAWLSK